MENDSHIGFSLTLLMVFDADVFPTPVLKPSKLVFTLSKCVVSPVCTCLSKCLVSPVGIWQSVIYIVFVHGAAIYCVVHGWVLYVIYYMGGCYYIWFSPGVVLICCLYTGWYHVIRTQDGAVFCLYTVLPVVNVQRSLEPIRSQKAFPGSQKPFEGSKKTVWRKSRTIGKE